MKQNQRKPNIYNTSVVVTKWSNRVEEGVSPFPARAYATDLETEQLAWDEGA